MRPHASLVATLSASSALAAAVPATPDSAKDTPNGESKALESRNNPWILGALTGGGLATVLGGLVGGLKNIRDVNHHESHESSPDNANEKRDVASKWWPWGGDDDDGPIIILWRRDAEARAASSNDASDSTNSENAVINGEEIAPLAKRDETAATTPVTAVSVPASTGVSTHLEKRCFPICLLPFFGFLGFLAKKKKPTGDPVQEYLIDYHGRITEESGRKAVGTCRTQRMKGYHHYCKDEVKKFVDGGQTGTSRIGSFTPLGADGLTTSTSYGGGSGAEEPKLTRIERLDAEIARLQEQREKKVAKGAKTEHIDAALLAVEASRDKAIAKANADIVYNAAGDAVWVNNGTLVDEASFTNHTIMIGDREVLFNDGTAVWADNGRPVDRSKLHDEAITVGGHGVSLDTVDGGKDSDIYDAKAGFEALRNGPKGPALQTGPGIINKVNPPIPAVNPPIPAVNPPIPAFNAPNAAERFPEIDASRDGKLSEAAAGREAEYAAAPRPEPPMMKKINTAMDSATYDAPPRANPPMIDTINAATESATYDAAPRPEPPMMKKINSAMDSARLPTMGN